MGSLVTVACVNQILSRITKEHLGADTDSLTLLTASYWDTFRGFTLRFHHIQSCLFPFFHLLLLHRKTWFAFNFISFFLFCFGFHRTWRTPCTGVFTQSPGSLFLQMLPSPSWNGSFSFLSFAELPNHHKKKNLKIREAIYILKLRWEDLGG